MSEESRAANHKLLIVDDEAALLQVLESYFSMQDFDVCCTHDGSQALELVEKFQPDLILCDVNMPELNGLEFCEMLHGIPGLKQIPFIFMSALPGPRELTRAKKLGALEFISKPFCLNELKALLGKHLKQAALPV
ncbi:MAG: response regulator [Methylacidiphilales bacterium]|nr:response regulator [Candidatus Methylacidiphilales bacterium]